MVARQTGVHSRKTTYFHHKLSIFVFFGLGYSHPDVCRLISFTFEKAGSAPILIILVGSLIGSSINIPLYEVRAGVPLVQEEFVRWFGITYRVPRVSYQETYTQVAVNIGGALIPVAMSFYLLAISSPSTVLSSLSARCRRKWKFLTLLPFFADISLCLR